MDFRAFYVNTLSYLDGAKASEPRNLAVLERVATKTTLEVQYGGGIKSRGALRSVFGAWYPIYILMKNFSMNLSTLVDIAWVTLAKSSLLFGWVRPVER